MKPEILLVEPMIPEIEAELDAAYKVHRSYRENEADTIGDAAGRIRAAVTGGGTGLPAAWFDRLPELGLVAVNGVGTDKVDLVRAKEQGVHVTITPGVLAEDVADIAMGLILSVLRAIPSGDHFVRDCRWAAGEKFPLGTSLRARRLGVLGLGQIGRALGARAQAFGMPISFFNRSPMEVPGWQPCESPVALAEQANVLAVCIAATPETTGLVDEDLISRLGPEGVVVNVARGSVVDEAALIAALRDGRLAGAGLDVFINEPAIDTTFHTLPNVVLTPHQGSATYETRRAMGRIVLDSLEQFFAGREPLAAIQHV